MANVDVFLSVLYGNGSTRTFMRRYHTNFLPGIGTPMSVYVLGRAVKSVVQSSELTLSDDNDACEGEIWLVPLPFTAELVEGLEDDDSDWKLTKAEGVA